LKRASYSTARRNLFSESRLGIHRSSEPRIVNRSKKSQSFADSKKGMNDDLKEEAIGLKMPELNVFGLPSSRKHPKKNSFVDSKSYKDAAPRVFTGRKSTIAVDSNAPFDKSDDWEECDPKFKSLVTLPNENIARETESVQTENAHDEQAIYRARA
jgi:hypothetical protein